jgi:branched-chain amino acid transport system substrate-binding protein
MRRMLCIVACLAALTTTAACGSSGGGSNDGQSRPFRILDITAQTGALAALGTPELQATKAAVNYLNSTGGIDGHHIDLEVKDDLSDPSHAVSILQDAINSGTKPDLVLPGVTSNETIALLPVLANNQIMSIATTGAAEITDTSKYPLSFGASFRPQDGPDAMAAYLGGKHYSTIGVLHADDAYGESWWQNMSHSLTAHSLHAVDVSYDPSKIDLTAELSRLHAQHPDVVVAEAFGSPAGAVYAARAKLGYQKTPFVADITISAGDPWSLVQDKDAFTNSVEQIYSVQRFAAPDQLRPAVKTMVTSVKKLGSIKAAISLYAGSWDPLQSVNAAVTRAKSLDPEAMAKAMTELQDDEASWAQNGGSAPGYTATSHFATASDANYAFVPPGPLKDGMVQPAA